jgi:chemotaxis signal transduction protein
MTNDSERADGHDSFLLVRSGGHRCAIPVAAASHVAGTGRLDPLPGSAPRLLGLTQVFGEPVAVVDLHALLDPEGRPGGGRALTVVVSRRGGRSSLGLAVDEALGVVALGVRDPAGESDPEWVSGRSRLAGRDIAVVDPDVLLAPADGGG